MTSRAPLRKASASRLTLAHFADIGTIAPHEPLARRPADANAQSARSHPRPVFQS